MSIESPLGVVLKTVARKKKAIKTIRVCNDCKIPLIWTFAFAYKERYCLNCGAGGGMIGTGEDVPITRELIFQKKLVDKIWSVIYGKKGFVPNSCQCVGCKKCVGEKKHYEHLSPSEKEWDKIARNYLEKFKGCLGPTASNT